MSVFYVRISGSDSNNGTSPALAWRTITKALSSTGISSGDTVYIGGGIYREIVTVGMTSATTETFIIGDIDGARTGDAGKVILTSQLSGDRGLGSAVGSPQFLISSRNFLTFNNIIFNSTNNGNNSCVQITTSRNIKFYKCIFKASHSGGSGNALVITVTGGIESNIIVDSCIVYVLSATLISITLPTVAGDDYDSKILIINCLLYSMVSNNVISVTSSSTLSGEGGGVRVINCYRIGGSGPILTHLSTLVCGRTIKYPNFVFNLCQVAGGAIGVAVTTEFGSIFENNNLLVTPVTVSRINIPPGLSTIANSSTNAAIVNFSPLHDIGENNLYNLKNLPFAQHDKQNLLVMPGNPDIAPDTDIFGYPLKAGMINVLFDGVINSTGLQTIGDSSKTFGNHPNLLGYNMKILNGPAAGYTKDIRGNTNTVITGNGLWPVNPNVGDKYVIYPGPNSYIGKVSTGNSTAAITTITDNYSSWPVDFWKGFTLQVISGVGSGQNFVVSGNSPTVISGHSLMSTIPNSGDIFEIFWGSLYRGTVSTGTQYTMTDNNAVWQTTRPTGTTGIGMGVWSTYTCMITEGVASGAYFFVSGQGVNTLSGWSPFAITPASGDKYAIYQTTGYPTGIIPSGYVPPYGRNYIYPPIGCYAVPNTAIKETGIVLSGANSIRLFGPAIQDFQVPVSGITTLSVFGYYDDYYSGIKPQLKILNGSGISIADNTATMLGASGQWEQLRLSFTGSSAGVITARLQSNCTNIGGSAYFDCWNVS